MAFYFTDSYIMLYLKKKIKKVTSTSSNNKTQKLSFKLAPYLFIAVAIFTAFSSNNGTWV